MKIHKFIDDFDLSKEILEITGGIAKQMALVLKLEIGEKVELCDGKGISAIAEIAKIDKKNVNVKITLSKSNFKNIDSKTLSEKVIFCVDNDGKEYDIKTGWFDPDPKVRKHIRPGELIHCRCLVTPVLPGF